MGHDPDLATRMLELWTELKPDCTRDTKLSRR